MPLTSSSVLRLQTHTSAFGSNSLQYRKSRLHGAKTPRNCRLANVAYNGWHSQKPQYVQCQSIIAKGLLQSYKHCLCCGYTRSYSLCCPPRPSGGCGCPDHVPGGGRKIVPPSTCRPGPIPPNPCVPVFPPHGDTWKKYKYIFFFICIPLIFIQAFRALSHSPPPKDVCRDYEYMRLRSKRFPWGDGVKSFFHNDHVNHLPGECEPPPLDCD